MHQDSKCQDGRQKKVRQQKILLGSVATLSALILGGVHPPKISAQIPSSPEQKQKQQKPLSPVDMLEIQQLYSQYFYALDGLLGRDSATKWANTFAPNGKFSIVKADGTLVEQATGRQALINLYKTFPNVETTRHWMNNLMIEPDTQGAKGGCYIIAMDIKSSPATIARSGLYKDKLVKISGSWKFQSRVLVLDASSSPPTFVRSR
ncbi:MAG: nuclear transport factor 2 family protein [Aphanothece sp. CMT-3BRIN-NPC111]|jgi:hypothetical protein|nr:nuclear transport factor 2 family protein [Aphanothece sp. CMT-3BRIN-NPC111]